VLDTNAATYRVPGDAGDTLVCIASATDAGGAAGRDTMRVPLLSWILSPNGGESFTVGDTVTIVLRGTTETLGLWISAVDGEYLLPVPGMAEQIIPFLTPTVTFVMPESIYHSSSQSWVSLLAACCRVRAFRYQRSSEFVESEGCFSVLPKPNAAPVALAGQGSVVLPGSQLVLNGDGTGVDGSVVGYEWLIDGNSDFVDVSNGDTTIDIPSAFNTDFLAVLRVTDDDGATGLDTLHTIVSWIESPNGGETFRIGDSMHVNLLAAQELVGIKLVVYRLGDEAFFDIPGFTAQFFLAAPTTVSFVLPDSLYDSVFGWMSPASDSCQIQVFKYMDPGVSVRSAGFFSIAQQ